MMNDPHTPSAHWRWLALALLSARVGAEPVPMDASQACPAAAALLEQELTPALRHHGVAGSARVQFRWGAAGAEAVFIRGAPHEYRQPLRRALRQLQCPGAPAGALLQLNLRFAPDA